MPLYEKFMGAAEQHHANGDITAAFTRMAGKDLGLAASAEQVVSIDAGFDPTSPRGMG